MIPKISIIIPMKNEASFIEECLESSLRQMHSSFQIEVVVVDDHSTDNSPSLVQRLSAQHPETITFLPNNGHGIIDALCTGLNAATGDYISRMDADDVMPDHKLRRLLEALIESPESDIATGKVTYISTGKELADGFVNYANWLNRINSAQKPFSEIYKECPIASPNWMMRMSKFKAVGGCKGAQYPEDYDLAFRWYEQGLKTVFVDHITHIWRDHQARASRNDPNYADNRFIELKVSRFLKIDYNPKVNLYLLGAGRKGKTIAKELIDRNIEFVWLTNNPKKINVNIYGVLLNDWDVLEDGTPCQLLSAVSSPTDIQEVQSKFGSKDSIHCFSFF
jgi:glycosyltransferase involved in cell wall biosynthesis